MGVPVIGWAAEEARAAGCDISGNRLTDGQVLFVLPGLRDQGRISLSADADRTRWQELTVFLEKNGYKTVNPSGEPTPGSTVEKNEDPHFSGRTRYRKRRQ